MKQYWLNIYIYIYICITQYLCLSYSTITTNNTYVCTMYNFNLLNYKISLSCLYLSFNYIGIMYNFNAPSFKISYFYADCIFLVTTDALFKYKYRSTCSNCHRQLYFYDHFLNIYCPIAIHYSLHIVLFLFCFYCILLLLFFSYLVSLH